jgi:hypothetical protein
MTRPIRHGTPREHAVGYSMNGESQFSRRAAHDGKYNERPLRRKRAQATDTRRFLAETKKRIAKLKFDISVEPSKVRRAKLQRDFDLKTALAARLEKEVAQMVLDTWNTDPDIWNWEDVETLPGENET